MTGSGHLAVGSSWNAPFYVAPCAFWVLCRAGYVIHKSRKFQNLPQFFDPARSMAGLAAPIPVDKFGFQRTIEEASYFFSCNPQNSFAVADRPGSITWWH